MTDTLLHPWDSPIGVPCLSCDSAGCAHCRFTGTAYDIAQAREPYNAIVHGQLFQGGHSCAGCYRCDPWPDGFDVILDMRRTEISPRSRPANVVHGQFAIADSTLTPEARRVVNHAVYAVLDSVHRGKRVLVRCHWGLNRSGLVVGLAMRKLGYGADETVDTIRSRRSPWALSNSDFEAAVRA